MDALERGSNDPDPFTIALGIFGAISGGAAFLETRRGRLEADRVHRDKFRAAWYAARRTVIHFKRLVDEFETYVLEDGYGRAAFRIGAVRIGVDFSRRYRDVIRLARESIDLYSDFLDDLGNREGFEIEETGAG